eukprot:CAMPEP_0114602012 /NCGR_PEP_ID=MMETSP0125-20121206/24642_1 /TAXON_ID=485358 ORGANISM="Aristerostoma sp., Strain ATCC 50986" /NCGR_SAMPLE_ID=MMETSP0125 /ASSEMBLY_ACC=CAM_ASM_000245 /LENGTH=97 /DNA_ID=CAMNT_0001811837 /DNA_START=329 /DNA_END=622 /DNA_ORIENTATION=-
MTSKTEGPQFWCLLKILVNKMREISKISRQVAPIVWLSTLKELSLPGVAASSESLVMDGERHSACITNKHELYTWGCGSNYRLGHGLLIDELVPKIV